MASVRSRDAVAAWGVYKKWRAHLPLPSPPGASPASSLQAPATQAAQGFRSYTHGWQRGQPLSLGALATLSHFLSQAPPSVHRALQGPCCDFFL